uniref:LNR domain-containing protein n=1 Tax=Lotharella globosa TaxID=91324 RepID=A0A7S3Y9F9_9EUKA
MVALVLGALLSLDASAYWSEKLASGGQRATLEEMDTGSIVVNADGTANQDVAVANTSSFLQTGAYGRDPIFSHKKKPDFHRGTLTGCDPKCNKWWVGDGRCDVACLNEGCGWDNGDCDLSEVPKIAFLHIRKTGGTSLHKYLALLYSDWGANVCRSFSWDCGEHCSCGFWDHNAKRNGAESGMDSCKIIQRTQKQGHTYCEGCVDEMIENKCDYVELHHWDMSVADELRKNGYKIITMLRDPSKQLESAYNYEVFTRKGAKGKLPDYPEGHEGFRMWVEDRTSLQGFDAARMLAGCWHEHNKVNATEFCKINPMYSGREELQKAYATGAQMSREEMFTKAREALTQMDFVGITERFSESLALLQGKLLKNNREECERCKKIRLSVKKENVNKHAVSFLQVPDLHDKLEYNLRHDHGLYNEALQIFHDELRKQGLPVTNDSALLAGNPGKLLNFTTPSREEIEEYVEPTRYTTYKVNSILPYTVVNLSTWMRKALNAGLGRSISRNDGRWAGSLRRRSAEKETRSPD